MNPNETADPWTFAAALALMSLFCGGIAWHLLQRMQRNAAQLVPVRVDPPE